MKIKNPKLTLVQDTTADSVKCTAGCQVELNALETAALLNPWHGGFRLTCELLAGDPGTDPRLFKYPKTKNFKVIADVMGLNQVFEADISTEILNEDLDGVDEIKAKFTLLDRSNGQSTSKRSPRVQINL